MKQLKIGLIGAGFMGRNLAKVVVESPLAYLQSVADIDEISGRKVAKAFEAAFYSDYSEMLAKENLDAVLIATPEHLHRDPVEKACAAGCHIFLEKPIASNWEDGTAIVRSCTEAKRKLMVGYILRFEPAYAHIEEAIRLGSIGKFLYGYARRIGSINSAKRLGSRVTVTTYIAVHDIDQMLWYHDVPVSSVTAKAVYGRVFEEVGTYDLAITTMEFEDGAIATIETGWALPAIATGWSGPGSWIASPDTRTDILGTKGRLWLGLLPMSLMGVFEDNWRFPDTRLFPQLHGKTVSALRNELEHFFECILLDQSPLSTGDNALRSLEVLLAAERSIAEKRPIKLQEER